MSAPRESLPESMLLMNSFWVIFNCSRPVCAGTKVSSFPLKTRGLLGTKNSRLPHSKLSSTVVGPEDAEEVVQVD